MLNTLHYSLREMLCFLGRERKRIKSSAISMNLFTSLKTHERMVE